MKRYDSYKDSGVEWIGEIPSHWEILKFGYLGKLKSGSGFPEKLQGREFGGDFPFFKVSDTNNEGNEIEMSISNNYVTKEEFETNNWTLFSENTIVFPKIGMGLLLNKRRILNQPSIIDNNMMGFTPNKRIDHKYSFYLLKLIDFKDYCSEGTVPSIGESQISPIKTNLPPLSEQQQIVSYLDTKTSLIDSLIEKTQRKIELLKEKRTSLINEVITKGLNPNVEMKDSGVEWIGEIPIHWECSKVKYFVNFDSGFSFKSDDYCDEGIPVIRIGSLYNNILSLDRSPVFLPKEFQIDYNQFIVEKDDILISMTGTLGKRDYGYSILYKEDFPSFLNQRVGRIRISSNKIILQYLMYCLLSESFLLQLFSKPTGTKQGNFSSEDIIGNYFGCPSTKEQQQIVEYLDEQTGLIDNIISIEEKRIELLKEYRQSLISEVVTGKRKVVDNNYPIIKNSLSVNLPYKILNPKYEKKVIKTLSGETITYQTGEEYLKPKKELIDFLNKELSNLITTISQKDSIERFFKENLYRRNIPYRGSYEHNDWSILKGVDGSILSNHTFTSGLMEDMKPNRESFIFKLNGEVDEFTGSIYQKDFIKIFQIYR